jgi:hypothetical protein
MTIKIKPAEIVGAAVGDRVSFETPVDAPPVTWYGHIAGLSTEYPGRVVVDLEDANEGRRHIEPERLSLASKKYAVGDEVGGKDFPHLPNGTVLLREKYLPAFKANGTWYVLDHGVPGGIREIGVLYERTRTIAWMPQSYTNQ